MAWFMFLTQGNPYCAQVSVRAFQRLVSLLADNLSTICFYDGAQNTLPADKKPPPDFSGGGLNQSIGQSSVGILFDQYE
jgi:hypothetical protein